MTSRTDFMAFLEKELFTWNMCLRNDDVSIFGKFLATFSISFSISKDFSKNYLHAKIQISWAIQMEITGGKICPPLPMRICEKPIVKG